MGPVLVVNVGASNGPRIATASFDNMYLGAGGRRNATVAVDLDGRQYQDEGPIRRRAARAAVPVAKQAAAAILNGLEPELEYANREGSWGRAAWMFVETFEGFERRASAVIDFNLVGENLAVPEAVTARAADDLMALSETLHVAIDDPAYRSVFGAR